MEKKEKWITDKEIQKLDNMYEGDKLRDARSKIRGFLFQDLVAINFLLEDDTKYICTEFLEDINVFKGDGTMIFIQVKYYPEGNINNKEIFTDLYYQYLRMKFLKSGLLYKAVLVVATNKKVNKWTAKKMKSEISSYVNDKFNSEVILEEDEALEWLRENIYSETKDVQKKELFRNISTDSKIKNFLSIMDIDKEVPDIEKYKEKLKAKLSDTLGFSSDRDCEYKQNILLGLSIMLVQQKYSLNDISLKDCLISRVNYLKYLSYNLTNHSEEYIQGYLIASIHGIYAELIEDIIDNVDTEVIEKLGIIAEGTNKFIFKLAEDMEGQFRIINTMSFKKTVNKEMFAKKTVDERIVDIAECRENLKSYLKILWKIILNININNKKNSEGKYNETMLMPETYVNDSVKEYISMKFIEEYKHELLLPSIMADPSANWQRIFERMSLIKDKPAQYFMKGSYRGIYQYSQKVTDVIKNKRVSDPYLKEAYNIECMDCISIELTDWNSFEKCEDCIFNEKCIKDKI